MPHVQNAGRAVATAGVQPFAWAGHRCIIYVTGSFQVILEHDLGKSNHFRRHSRPQLIAVLLAVLAQLHLLFVVEIHHHEPDPNPGTIPGQVSVIQPYLQTSQPPLGHFCAACQVARQGSVRPASDGPAAFRVPQWTRAIQANTPSISLAPSLLIPSRAPPPLA